MDKAFEQYVREEFTRVEQSQEKFNQRQEQFSKELAEIQTRVTQWGVGLFVGFTLIILTAGGLYISVLLNLK